MLMIVAFLGVIGVILGSFVNAFVWRLHEHKNWVSERSECTHCHHLLSVKDLIPVLSWIFLKGKCRYCKRPISFQYPLVELATAIIFVSSYIFWPKPVTGYQLIVFGLWLIMWTGLMSLIVYDLRWMLLPNKVVLFLTVLAVLMALVNLFSSGDKLGHAINYLLAAGIGGGLFYLIFAISGGKWIGGGDVKLGFMLGILSATAAQSFLLIFIAAILGSLISVPLLLIGRMKKNSVIPFGPFLIAAAFIVKFAGSHIIHWYTGTFIVR